MTSKYLILIEYVLTTINFGLDDCEKLESIYVALREDKTEYELIVFKLNSFIEQTNSNIIKMFSN